MGVNSYRKEFAEKQIISDRSWPPLRIDAKLKTV